MFYILIILDVLMNDKLKQNKKIVGILSAAVFVIFTVLVCWYIGRPMLKLVSKPDVFRDWIDSKGFGGRFIFVGMVALQVIFAIIPGEPLEIGAGYAFGSIEGTVLCIIGSFVGSAVIFAFTRKWGIQFVELFFPREKINKLRFLDDNKKLNLLAFVIFMIPGTPKDILTYFLGITKITPLAFFLTVTVARIPSVITSTIGGDALGMKNYVFAIVTFVVTLVISVIGLFIYNCISSHHSKKS